MAHRCRGLDKPIDMQSSEFEREFGGLWRDSMLSYAVQHFFLNGATDALIVRVFDPTGTLENAHTRFDLPGSGGTLVLRASNPGTWAGEIGVDGDRLEIFVDHETADPSDDKLFNLTIRRLEAGVAVATEVHRNLSVDADSPRFVGRVLELESEWVRLASNSPSQRPDGSLTDAEGHPIPATISNSGEDGGPIGFDQVADPGLVASRRGIWALEEADLFNPLCIPPFERDVDVDPETWTTALAYARTRRAMLIIDPPSTWPRPADVLSDLGGGSPAVPMRGDNGIVYYPRVRMADPRQENRLATFAPCGVIAGIIARTDARRGVWKAPAGEEATLIGVRELAYRMNDGENGRLNPLGINALRTFRGSGSVVWGARTLRAPTGSPHRGSTYPRPTPGLLHRREPVPRDAGSFSSRTTSRSGRRSASTSVPSCTTRSGKAPFRGAARGRLLREMRSRDDDAGRHRPRHRGICSSGSRRSSRRSS